MPMFLFNNTMPDDAHIFIQIETGDPIELVDLTVGLMSVASRYCDYMQTQCDEPSEDECKLYVREITHGSILVDLISYAPLLKEGVDNIRTFIDFVEFYKDGIKPYFQPKGRNKDLPNSALSDFMDGVKLISGQQTGKVTIAAATFQSGTGKKKIFTELSFDADTASLGRENMLLDKEERGKKHEAEYEKMLLYFHQTNVGEPKKYHSGERAIIEEITDKPLPVVYVSDLAGEKIKSTIRLSKENPFGLGFIVDVNVQTVKGKPACYRVIHLHEVVEV